MIRRTAKWWVPVVVGAGIVLVGWLTVLPRFTALSASNGFFATAPSRAAQANLNSVVTVVQRQYAATGTLGSEPALAALVRDQEHLTLVSDRSVLSGAAAPIAVALSADRQAALFATRADDGRCWFAEVDHQPTSPPPPFPGTPAAPGTYYGGAGTGHGPNRGCSVTHGPAGTSGNAFVGWTAGAYPQGVP